MIEDIEKFAQHIKKMADYKFLEATIQEVEECDGRRDRGNLLCKKASILYIAYNNEIPLYVGETSKSIKRRFISDGSGCHKKANSSWFQTITKIKYLVFENDDLPTPHRKLMEQLLIIAYNPKYNWR